MARTGKSTRTSRIAKPADVDTYIAAAPSAVQAQLRQLRAAIQAEAPNAVEKMSYGIPFYEYGGKPGTLASRLIYFASQKNHIAVYPAGEAKGLEQYLTERSTLRFPLGKPLPMAKIRSFIKARVKEKDAATKGTREGARIRSSKTR